jgi:hypothetical protein
VRRKNVGWWFLGGPTRTDVRAWANLGATLCRRVSMFGRKVGIGFDHDLLRRLGEKLARLETPGSPFAEDGLPRRGVH